MPAFRPWLFRIAHNRALDHLRRYEARMSEPLDAVRDSPPTPPPRPPHEQAVSLAVSRFSSWRRRSAAASSSRHPPLHSLEEIGGLLELSLPAVKAALHRGRTRLRELAAQAQTRTAAPADFVGGGALRRPVQCARLGWRAHHAGPGRATRSGVARAARGQRGGQLPLQLRSIPRWRLAPAWLEGREVIAVFRAPEDARPGYFIELGFEEDQEHPRLPLCAICDGRCGAGVPLGAAPEMRVAHCCQQWATHYASARIIRARCS